MTRSWVAATAVAVALLAPSGAAAGGWATVGLDPMPEDVRAGEPWDVQLTVLQHGVTPLRGLHPKVIVTNGDQRLGFLGRPTGEPGVYRAKVVFPSAGSWRYVVDDDFTSEHGFPPVQVAGAAPAAEDESGGLPLGTLLLGVAGVVVVAAAALAPRRRSV